MKNTLVVYFSRSGYTRAVAQQLADRIDADVEALQEGGSRAGWRGYWRSAREALGARPVEIDPASLQPRDYALVVLGTPVWAGNMSSPVRAYINQHRGELRNLALFCTQGGSGGAKVLQKMAALYGRAPLATAVFNDAAIDAGTHLAELDAFCRALTRASV